MQDMLVISSLVACSICRSMLAEAPWPAESMSEATNLTSIEGPEPNDFYVDLSGAFWNPVTRRLWVCRNGPGGIGSKFWAICENGNGGYEIDCQNGNRGEWTGCGDLEGITQADFNEDVVYLAIEGKDLIKEYDVSTYGALVLQNSWYIGAYVPVYSGGLGSEGIAFVPDEFLAGQGFVDQNGNPYTSQNGMGGLMFIAHQNGGRLYAFDLNRTNGTLIYVGVYKTNYSESCELAYDRSERLLYIFHGADYNTTEVVRLSSTVTGGERQLESVITYASPGAGNLEGIAIMRSDDCAPGNRKFFLTIDGGGATSLLMFNHFPSYVVGADTNGDGCVNLYDLQLFVAVLIGTSEDPAIVDRADLNGDGEANGLDIQMMIEALLNQPPELPGDIDDDCDVDVSDLPLFVAVLLGEDADPDHVARADMNDDDFTNGLDIQPFVKAVLGCNL